MDIYCAHCKNVLPFPRIRNGAKYCNTSCMRVAKQEREQQRKTAEAEAEAARRDAIEKQEEFQRLIIEARHAMEAITRPKPKPRLPPGFRATSLAEAETIPGDGNRAINRAESLTGGAAAACYVIRGGSLHGDR